MLNRIVRLVGPLSLSGARDDEVVLRVIFVVRLLFNCVPIAVTHRQATDPAVHDARMFGPLLVRRTTAITTRDHSAGRSNKPAILAYLSRKNIVIRVWCSKTVRYRNTMP